MRINKNDLFILRPIAVFQHYVELRFSTKLVLNDKTQQITYWLNILYNFDTINIEYDDYEKEIRLYHKNLMDEIYTDYFLYKLNTYTLQEYENAFFNPKYIFNIIRGEYYNDYKQQLKDISFTRGEDPRFKNCNSVIHILSLKRDIRNSGLKICYILQT